MTQDTIFTLADEFIEDWTITETKQELVDRLNIARGSDHYSTSSTNQQLIDATAEYTGYRVISLTESVEIKK